MTNLDGSFSKRTPINIQDIADELLRARAERAFVAPISSRDTEFGLAAAYDVALEILRRRKARGEVPVGRKIGFNNRNIWPAFNLDTPTWAHVFDTTVRHVEGGVAELSLADFVAPHIEPEIILGDRSEELGRLPEARREQKHKRRRPIQGFEQCKHRGNGALARLASAQQQDTSRTRPQDVRLPRIGAHAHAPEQLARVQCAGEIGRHLMQ
jgi:hypothetical protein